jgi:hypothetical protein
MDTDLIYKMLRYLSAGIIIYLLFKLVPKQPMKDKDIMTISTIAVLVYAVLENMSGMFWGDNTSGKLLTQSQCDAQKTQNVDQSEHMTNSESLQSAYDNLVAQREADDKANALAATPVESVALSDASTVESVTSSDASTVEIVKTTQPNTIVRNEEGGYNIGLPSNPQVASVGSRQENDVMLNEMGYSDHNDLSSSNYVDYNNFPQYDANKPGINEFGYSFLPPANWYPTPPHPPVCVTEKKCPVCPLTTVGYPVDLKEWNATTRVMPADTINTSYIAEKLNSGR